MPPASDLAARESAWTRRARHALVMARLAVPYLVFGVLKRVCSLPRLARLAWRKPPAVRNRELEAAAERCAVRLRRIARADRGDCLQASLALYGLLAAAGADPRLIVGFRRTAGSVRGHAWVEVDGHAVAEAPPDREGFAGAAVFGAGGRLVTDASGGRS